MTAALVWAILILAGSGLYLAGEINGRRSERRLGRARIGRANSVVALEAVSMNDAAELADNDRWSRKVTRLEVIR
jgi:hypothetical protein